jgi:hypothetical protein
MNKAQVKQIFPGPLSVQASSNCFPSLNKHVSQLRRYTANRWTDPEILIHRPTNRRSATIGSSSMHGQDQPFKDLVNWSFLFALPLSITTLPGKPITLFIVQGNNVKTGKKK